MEKEELLFSFKNQKEEKHKNTKTPRNPKEHPHFGGSKS